MAEVGAAGALSPGGPPADEPPIGGIEDQISPGEVDGESGGRWNKFALVYWQ